MFSFIYFFTFFDIEAGGPVFQDLPVFAFLAVIIGKGDTRGVQLVNLKSRHVHTLNAHRTFNFSVCHCLLLNRNLTVITALYFFIILLSFILFLLIFALYYICST